MKRKSPPIRRRLANRNPPARRHARTFWARFSRHPRIAAVLLLAVLSGGIWLAGHRARSTMSPVERHAAHRAAMRPAAAPAPIAVRPKPAEQAALRVPRRSPPQHRAEPAWLRFAVPAPPTGDRPLVAIVIDDLGLDRRRTAEVIRLPGPVTLSFMTYAEDLAQQTATARRAGHELLLHVPMQPIDPHQDPGPHALYTSLTTAQILDRLSWDLGRFDGYVGINNHMGSRFTADARAMAPVMAELRARGLLFLDSRTTAKSAAIPIAVRDRVPHAARDVFLDDIPAPGPIERQLEIVERIARRRGSAIAIGHAHDATIAVLRNWLPTVRGRGLALVPLSAVVRARMAGPRTDREAAKPAPPAVDTVVAAPAAR